MRMVVSSPCASAHQGRHVVRAVRAELTRQGACAWAGGDGLYLWPSLLQGGSERIGEASSELERYEREQDALEQRRRAAEVRLEETLRVELEDSVGSLQRQHSHVLDFVQRCSHAVGAVNEDAVAVLDSQMRSIEALRTLLDEKEEMLRQQVMAALEARLALLDEQMRTYAVAAPEADELLRRVRGVLQHADPRALIASSGQLIAEIERMSERAGRLPSPADGAPLDTIEFVGCEAALQAVARIDVRAQPAVLYVVPCTGNVSGGTTLRVEGQELSGADVRVFIGGVLCEHVGFDHGGGAHSALSVALPPCQGDLKVDVVVEVDGRRARGALAFHYTTPAPRVAPTPDAPAHAADASFVRFAVRGAGFAAHLPLNEVTLCAGAALASAEASRPLPCQVEQAGPSALLVAVPRSALPAAGLLFASVQIAGVSSGDPAPIARLGGGLDHGASPPSPPASLPASAAASPPRGAPHAAASPLDRFPPSGSPARARGGAPQSRVLRSERALGRDSGTTHVGVEVRSVEAWGALGVLVEGAAGGEGARVRGVVLHSNGVCTNGLVGGRTDTGARWGAGDVLGLSVCFLTSTVTFYVNGRHAHTARGLGPDPVVVFCELGGSASFSQFVPFTPMAPAPAPRALPAAAAPHGSPGAARSGYASFVPASPLDAPPAAGVASWEPPRYSSGVLM